jgi:signal recognition particle receptor subunit beta
VPVVNYAAREITCKIVYYGPGRSGKTSNLQYIHRRAPMDRRGEMMSLATHGDRTLFFDFLPLDLGTLSGFTTRFQLYTVPGQVYYRSTRRLVLQGADGVVFVADSQRRQLEENVESYRDLHEALAEQGVDARELPMVLQYNKQDLPPEPRNGWPPQFPRRPQLPRRRPGGEGSVRNVASRFRARAAPPVHPGAG